MKKSLVYVVPICAALAIWIVGFGCWPCVHWSALNCSREDIDINSGRIRRQWFVAGLCIRESVESTSLSRLVADDGEHLPPDWHRVNTFSPLVHYSPHYAYHGAIAQIKLLELLGQSAPFTTDVRRKMARDVLALWQLGNGYSPVDDYLDKVERLAQDPSPSITVEADDVSLNES